MDTTPLTLDTLRRQLVWDLIPCPEANEFMPKVKLHPASEEGVEVEHRASHRRLNTVLPVLPVLGPMSEIAGAVMGRSLLDTRKESYTEAEGLEQTMEVVRLSRALCIAVIANMIDTGYLHLPHTTYVTAEGEAD